MSTSDDEATYEEGGKDTGDNTASEWNCAGLLDELGQPLTQQKHQAFDSTEAKDLASEHAGSESKRARMMTEAKMTSSSYATDSGKANIAE